MSKIEKNNISIIIPSYKSEKYIVEVLRAINSQTIKPLEVLIIDYKTSNKFSEIIKRLKLNLNTKLIDFSKKPCPPDQRNYGAILAKGEILAFLDVKTIPKKTWLENYYKLLSQSKYKIIFGRTKFYYNNTFQKLLLFASYGNLAYETVPGTLIFKKDFLKIGKFVENVRAGEDEEWRQRIRNLQYEFYCPKDFQLSYSELPNNIFEALNKYFVYSMYATLIEVQQNTKNLYLIILLFFSAIFIPKWNYFLDGWDQNPLFIPNITKAYVLAIVLVYLIYLFINFFINSKKNIYKSVFFKTFSYVLLAIITMSVFFWNANVAKWVEDAVWYFPHITKIYLSSIFLMSLIIRGIIMPYNRQVPLKSIFITNWIIIGIIGICLDIIKAPGYILGAIMLPIIRIKKFINL